MDWVLGVRRASFDYRANIQVVNSKIKIVEDVQSSTLLQHISTTFLSTADGQGYCKINGLN